jgi:glycosyltransferase involved in cell wall biosynthesis
MKVSVVMTTYNHEDYISQAVQSALMQKVAFDYEIVIIEDCSTDRTRDIVRSLERRHPDRIRLVLPATNCNDSRNFARVIETAPSQYIACLEGDDYWTCREKLQKQVAFLDDHPECATCFHNVRQQWEDGRSRTYNAPDQKPITGMGEILAGNFIATASVMFRRGLFGAFPEWFFRLPIGDWPLHVLNTQYGRIGYLADVMGVYRVHSRGLWSQRSRSAQLETVLRFYRDMNANLDFKYDQTIRRQMAQAWFDLALTSEDEDHDLGYARTCVANSLRVWPYNGTVPTWDRLKRWIRLSAERLGPNAR